MNFHYSFFQWVTLFDDSAQTLVGLAAHELRSLFDRDPDLFRRKLHDVKFSLFEFVSKTKCEKFNDENRIKMTVINAKPITQHSEGRRMERLKQEIESMRQLLTEFSRN
jgi:Replication factor-A C terminal domain